jgi:hypothetical protein
MKKTIIVTLLFFVFIFCSAYHMGPALYGAGNCTGSAGAPRSCGGSSCHSNNNTATQDTITVIDKTTGLATLSYKPGQTYTVTLSGKNSSTLPKFGFQVSATLIDHTQAGTMTITAAKTQLSTTAGVSIVENSNSIDMQSGGRYFTQFDWTAPASGSGFVTFYGILCAVDGDGYATGSDITNPAQDVILHEWTIDVPKVGQAGQSKVYPNPFSDHLFIGTEIPINATINVFDLTGREIISNYKPATNTINTSTWGKGVYIVQIIQDCITETVQVIKQ